MYCNLTKTQSFPLVFGRPSMLKQIYTSKPQSLIQCSSNNLNFGSKSVINCSVQESHCFNEMGSFGMVRRTSLTGFCIKNAILNGKVVVARGLSSSSSQRIVEGGKKERFREVERNRSVVAANAGSDEAPWEVSVEKYLEETSQSVEDEGVSRSRSRNRSYRDGDGGGDGRKKTMPGLRENSRDVKRNKSVVTANANKSTWEVSAERYLKGGSLEDQEVYKSRSRDSSDDGDGTKLTLPWLETEKSGHVKRNESVVTANANKSTWEVSAGKYLKGGPAENEEVYGSRSRQTSHRDGDVGGDGSKQTTPWLANRNSREIRRNERVGTTNAKNSRWEASSTKYMKGGHVEDEEVYRSRSLHTSYRGHDSYKDSDDDSEEEEEEGEDFEDRRWDNNNKNRFRMEVEAPYAERPELRRWNKQESWGKKTWKEATESTVPKLSGEAIYGVGPVLAAVCAGRRELYALYVQGGLDLSGNNKKKKDKKGVEQILRMAEKLGLSKSEVSKHDLNMVSDNRPHQGLVLDASPLEMVGIKELEPVSVDEENPPLWVALDEVTDPQNLGAIIRSSYFFGASGVVLCAKNSAPLSGVVSKASAGSLEMVELRSCKNMMQFLTSSAENGWRVVGGSVSSRAVPLDEIPPGAPTIIVLGSEGTGLRPLVERSCSQLVKIPGNPPSLIARADEEVKSAEAGEQFQAQDFRSFMAVESLNVSVATGVLLHHFIGLNYKHNNPIRETKS